MSRRVIAALLAVLMILLTFGCGKASDNKNNKTTTSKNDSAENGKIAVIIGDPDQAPEVYAAAGELAAAHPESVMLVKYDENFHTDPTAVARVTAAVAENPVIKAVIFADGVKGTAAAVNTLREKRSDICIVVCNPHESSIESKAADLMLSVDFPALGTDMVKKAKEMGAENFVFYSTRRHLKYSSVIALRQAAEAACKDEGLTFYPTASIDLYESGRTLDSAKTYLNEDAARKDEKLGKKTALFCTEPQVQGALAAEAEAHGMVMPATFMPSPLSLCADLGVDLSDHGTDSAYAMQQLGADSVGVKGTVATWGFSAYVAFVRAAYDYAAGVLAGSGKAASVERVEKLLAPYTAGAKFTVKTDALGAYLVQSDLITL